MPTTRGGTTARWRCTAKTLAAGRPSRWNTAASRRQGWAAAEAAGQSPELNGDQIVYDVGEDWLRVRCTPQGEYFYGTLVQNTAAAQWQSMDGKQRRSVRAAQTVSMERRVPELQQQGERYLRLQAGRPHQLVQLPGHRRGQLRRHRGQRWRFYRGGFLHGLCAVL